MLEAPNFVQVHNISLPAEGANVIRTTGGIFEDLTIGFVVLPWVVALEMTMGLKALSRKNGYKIDHMQEMVALGMANFAQSFVGGIPSTCAAPRMALMDQLKSKSPFASLFSGITALIFIAVGSELFYYSPRPPIAAVIVGAGLNFIDFSIAKLMWKEYPRDVIVFTVTFLTCVFYDMTYGLFLSFLVQLCMYLTPSIKMNVTISRIPLGNEDTALVITLPVSLHYPGTDKFCDRIESAIERNKDITHIILDCKMVTGTDYTGIQGFRRVIVMAIRHQKNLVFSNLNHRMRRKLEAVGLENFRCAESVDEAIIEYNNVRKMVEKQMSQQTSGVDAQSESLQQEQMQQLQRQTIEQIIQTRVSPMPKFYQDIPMAVGIGDDSPATEQNPSSSAISASNKVKKRKSLAMKYFSRDGDFDDVVTGADAGDEDVEGSTTFQFRASEIADVYLPPSRSLSKRSKTGSSRPQSIGRARSSFSSVVSGSVVNYLRSWGKENIV